MQVSSFAGAVAASCAFAASVPLGVNGAAFRAARAALALVAVPLLLSVSPYPTSSAVEAALRGAIIGVSLGLAATVVFAAAGAAGAIVSNALAWSPVAGPSLEGGPIALLYQIGFLATLLATGGVDRMLVALAESSSTLPSAVFSVAGTAQLAALSARASITLAAPALFAQALATLAAGFAARAAPQASGLLTTGPLVTLAVGVSLFVAAGTLFENFAAIARDGLTLFALH